jgi:methionyl-tRNA synthetase
LISQKTDPSQPYCFLSLQICDKYNALHSGIYDWFNISFDKFGRTTTEKQTEVAQSIFWDLHGRGNLREDSMSQLFCEKCSRFLADR